MGQIHDRIHKKTYLLNIKFFSKIILSNRTNLLKSLSLSFHRYNKVIFLPNFKLQKKVVLARKKFNECPEITSFNFIKIKHQIVFSLNKTRNVKKKVSF